MQQVQMIFDEAVAIRKKIKGIKLIVKDALDSSLEYKELGDKIKTLREKRNQVALKVKQDLASEMAKLDDLTIDLNSQMELLSDAALSKFMKGETLEITDEYENQYEPAFKVRFKRK
jgi:hypothetical protein